MGKLKDAAQKLMEPKQNNSETLNENKQEVNLNDLINRIKNEAGFMLYVHACDRGDINDYRNYLTYTRALHNLKHDMGSDDFVTGALNNLTKRLIKDSYNCIYHNPVTKIISELLGNKERQKQLEKNHETFTTYTISKLTSEPVIKKESGTYSMIERLILTGRNEPVTLNDILEKTEINEQAYCTSFHINVNIMDGIDKKGRPSYFGPTLFVYSSKELAQEIINYLRKNPKDYEKIISEILPRKEYPNINTGILDKQVSTDKLAIIIYNKLEEYLQKLNPEIKKDYYKTVLRGLIIKKQVQKLVPGDEINKEQLHVNNIQTIEELIQNITDVYNK